MPAASGDAPLSTDAGRPMPSGQVGTASRSRRANASLRPPSFFEPLWVGTSPFEPDQPRLSRTASLRLLA